MYQLSTEEANDARNFLQLIHSATPPSKRMQPVQTRRPLIEKHRNHVQEAMESIDLAPLADRSQPLDLPAGVTAESLLKELGKVLFADITTPRYYRGML